MAALLDSTVPPERELAGAVALLASLSTPALEEMLDHWLLPGMRNGDAGLGSWRVAGLVRSELRRRER